jgi:hypothetical protein
MGCISCGCVFFPGERVGGKAASASSQCSPALLCEDVRARACASCTTAQQSSWADKGGKRVECRTCHRLFLSRSGRSTYCADCRARHK